MKPGEQPNDVRMRGFSSRKPVADAHQWIDESAQSFLNQHYENAVEPIDLADAGGRVITDAIFSDVSVPGFRRSMMDGFAIRSADVLGASTYNPIDLKVIGEVLPGQNCEHSLSPHTAVRVMTGAAVPDNADAVLPVEKVEVDSGKQMSDCDLIQAMMPIADRKNIAEVGEDICRRDLVIQKGRALRPQDIGVLASVGVGTVNVLRRPKVRILTTGNEILPVGSKPKGMQIVDSNSPMLSTLVQRDGGKVLNPGIVRDEPDAILAAMQDDADVILVSGGSSAGKEDYAPILLREHGDLAIHGIAMRPSSPAGMGRLENRFVFLLPGNPVSCLCAYDFFASRCIRQLGGLNKNWPYHSIRLPLASKISSTIGRTDYMRVRIENDQIHPIAISGASILSSTTKADGFVVVEQDCEGYPAGHELKVHLY